MAMIKNSNPKQVSGGYERLVGNKDLALIFTKAQSTVISNGTELEKIISEKSNNILNLDKFIEECDKNNIDDGSYLCTKKILQKSNFKLPAQEPDFIVFEVNSKSKNLCYIIELKDGDAFDTKKSIAEKEMLESFVNYLSPKIPFRTKYYICCFNQSDKNKIVSGFKNIFVLENVMTGREFCDILDINYDNIVKVRKNDIKENFNYITNELFEIKEIKNKFFQSFRSHISEYDFYHEEEL